MRDLFSKFNRRWLLVAGLVWVAAGMLAHGAQSGGTAVEGAGVFPLPLSAYADDGQPLGQQLAGRVKMDPFNLVASVIFALAILHTFMAVKFQRMAHHAEHEHKKHVEALRQKGKLREGDPVPVSFKGTLFHFLGEVEAVFGIWAVPLLAAVTVYYGMEDGFGAGWERVAAYLGSLSFNEAIFVVIIMAIAATRPVVRMAENLLGMFAGLGGRTPGAWWVSILTVAPLLGSLITEPGAMTIAAMLLSRKFYVLGPSKRLKYATLGLLFVNISVGGTLTHFAAPPVLMVASKWGWTTPYMFHHFGAEAAIAIVVSNIIYFSIFRGEFAALKKVAEKRAAEHEGERVEAPIPGWVSGTHLFFLAWSVVTLHDAPLLVGGFLFFLAFTQATAHHQTNLNLRGPMMVGFFLAGLVVHGGLQSWWIAPVLGSLSEFMLFVGAGFLTSFNDNAAITYLASLSPQVTASKALQHAVMEGAVAGGGMTVIANAPNPAGQSLLAKHFGNEISPLWLAAGAAVPTLIVSISFRVLGAIL